MIIGPIFDKDGKFVDYKFIEENAPITSISPCVHTGTSDKNRNRGVAGL